MAGWRVPAELNLEGADNLVVRAVEPQCCDGGPPGGADADEFGVRPAEVMVSLLAARVEEGRGEARFRIEGGLSGAFAQRAMDAGEGEIGERAGTAGGGGNDVIHMEGRGLAQAREPAIFATPARSRDHSPAERDGNRHNLLAQGLHLRAEFQDGKRAGHLRQGFGLLFVRQG